jgi:hypothetical protein
MSIFYDLHHKQKEMIYDVITGKHWFEVEVVFEAVFEGRPSPSVVNNTKIL